VILPKIAFKNQKNFRSTFQSWKEDSLMEQLRLFVGSGYPYRFFGLKGHDNARQYLRDFLQKQTQSSSSTKMIEQVFEFKKTDIKQFFKNDFEENFAKHFKKEDIEYQKWSKFLTKMELLVDQIKLQKGINFIWKKEVDPSRPWIIITAGYDTIGIDWENLSPLNTGTFPGADCNGSSVAIALGLVTSFAKLNFENNLMIVFTDMQQLAYQGTLHFIENLGKNDLPKKNSIALAISLEMLGHDSKIFDKDKKLGNLKIYSTITGSATHEKEAYPIEFIAKANSSLKSDIHFEWIANQFENSDAFRFWEKQIPSIVFTQNWEKDFNHKRYLTIQDIPESINAKTLTNALKYIGQGIWYLLNDPNLMDTAGRSK